MKKIILSLSIILCVATAVSAQDSERLKGSTTKSGQNILPATGDFALGIEATPLLEYAGNIFNGNLSNSASDLFQGKDFSIYGKYFLMDDQAVRARLTLNFLSDSYKGTVTNDAEIANNPLNTSATAVDVEKNTNSDVELMVGYEFRRGYGRLQGFYGGEVGLGFGTGKSSYEYGNPMTALNQSPSSIDFFGSRTEQNMGTRPTEYKSGSGFSFKVGGFVGVEYFFAPKMSIGGELGLGLVFDNKGQDEITVEEFDGVSGNVQTINARYRNPNEQASNAGFKTVTTGNLFVMFYF